MLNIYVNKLICIGSRSCLDYSIDGNDKLDIPCARAAIMVAVARSWGQFFCGSTNNSGEYSDYFLPFLTILILYNFFFL